MRVFLTLSLALLLASCAGPTYREKSKFGDGYSETRLSENIFRVSYEGTISTDQERATDFAWLRAAELTLKNGYRFFKIIDRNSLLKTETRSQPSPYSIYGSYLFQYGETVSSSTTPTTSIIVLMSDKKSKNEVFYSADFLVREIRSKYEISSREN